jgi:hypothetical protein
VLQKIFVFEIAQLAHALDTGTGSQFDPLQQLRVDRHHHRAR